MPLICALQSADFQVVFITSSNLMRFNFLFPIVLGINLIPFLDGKKYGSGVHSIICLWFFEHLLHHLREAERTVRTLCKGHNGDNLREKQNKECKIWATESANSSR